MDKEKVINFLNDQIRQADFRAKGYVYDENNQKRPKRSIFIKLNSYLSKFLQGDFSVRWLTLTGLRGAGKTTLLFQIYHDNSSPHFYRLFLSVDQIVQLLGSNLHEVLSTYEELIGKPFENLDRPLVLFLDEVQYDPQWGVTLKSIYDRSNKVFILATGSSALLMNQNTDVSRRTIYEKLFPLNFTEYLKIKLNKYEQEGLGRELRQAIFESQDAISVYQTLKKKETAVNSYLLGISAQEYEHYLNFGSLPFMITLKNESLVYDQIHKMIERIIGSDLAVFGNLSSEVVAKIPRLLYAVSEMDIVNFSKIASTFELSRPKVAEIFELLERTETLTKIFPYASNFNQARKPSKYLFSSPSFRAMYYKIGGSIVSYQYARGKLWEDLVGMYLKRLLYNKINSFLAYDSSEGGADFILGFAERKIVIEVGTGEKGYKQVKKTAQKVKSDYNLVIAKETLDYSKEYNAIKIPLNIFLLI